MTKTLHELRTTGFNKLRPGRIHLRCPRCGRKQSNVERGEHDPESTFLIEVLCDKCGVGYKDECAYHFDAAGNQVHLCDDCLERDAQPNDDYCAQCRAQLDEELADS